MITVAHTNTYAAIKHSKYNKLVAYDDEHYILNSSFRALFRGQWKWFRFVINQLIII